MTLWPILIIPALCSLPYLLWLAIEIRAFVTHMSGLRGVTLEHRHDL